MGWVAGLTEESQIIDSASLDRNENGGPDRETPRSKRSPVLLALVGEDAILHQIHQDGRLGPQCEKLIKQHVILSVYIHMV